MPFCQACGTAYDAGTRAGFRDACDQCGADLHACLNCKFYESGAHNDCREPEAELVVEKDRANRCEWFEPSGKPPGGEGRPNPKAAAKAKLDALFRKKG